jgi:hypothetical protein
MFTRPLLRPLMVAAFLCVPALSTATAGSPSPLPSSWTAASESPPSITDWGFNQSAPFLQAISFFAVVLLATAWAVKALVSMLRKDWPAFPALSYRGSLGLVLLWGLLFIIVLTMISGARELMTPGAWRKRGWTYKLSTDSALQKSPDQMRGALEQLRQALWQYAATHDGHFPPTDAADVDPHLWEIPGWPALRFLYVPNRQAESTGQLLAYAPELDDENRPVLLTNGLIGQMRTDDIRAALAKEPPNVHRYRSPR